MLPRTSLACRLEGHPWGVLLPAPRSSAEPFSTLLYPTTGIIPPGFSLPSGLGPTQRIPWKSRGSSSTEACWVKDAITGQVLLRTRRPASPPNPFALLSNFPWHTDKHTSPSAHFSVRETSPQPPSPQPPTSSLISPHLDHYLSLHIFFCSCLSPNLPMVPTTMK